MIEVQTNSEEHNHLMKPTINYAPTNFHLSYGIHQPVISIEPGTVVTTRFPDFHGQDASLTQVAGQPNPMVGPFCIPEVMPGDTL
ncbi:MAG: hypothetical protein JXA25_00055, partial [Anaerolineales bacterium]|nr:hypothetical protein [Anaerolineales bacterium]